MRLRESAWPPQAKAASRVPSRHIHACGSTPAAPRGAIRSFNEQPSSKSPSNSTFSSKRGRNAKNTALQETKKRKLVESKAIDDVQGDIEDLTELRPLPMMVHARLRESGLIHEPPDTHEHKQPILDSLFATILSQATSGVNSSRAFAELKRRFPTDWGSAYRAGPQAIEEAIRSGGLANRKAIRLHKILDQIKADDGSFSLEHLRDQDDDVVIKELTKYDGVGPKTAACVCMFNLGRAEMPVDTHVNRIACRLGWTAAGTNPEATYKLLNKRVPDNIKYSLHVQLVEHGQRTCVARIPKCSACPLRDICPSHDDMRTKGDTS